MPSARSPWRLLLPKWLLLHLFVIAASITMVLLGQWQWRQAHRHHGEILNYSYAFQWWAFTAFAILMWYRVVRDYLQTVDGAKPQLKPQPETARYVGYQPPTASVLDDDPERARFNAYLASLDSADRADGADKAERADLAEMNRADREESR
ncbi:MAG TPA: hypothetical protein VGH11_15005 [Jatrophihabitans sp.]